MMLFLITFIFLFLSIGFIVWKIKKDKGPKEPISAFWIAFLFGILSIVLSVVAQSLIGNYFESSVGDVLDLDPSFIISGNLLILFIYSLLNAFSEEFFKFVPLAFFIYKKSYFNEFSDGVVYFAISGMTFGLLENIFYSLTFGVTVGIGRLIITPLFHASLTALLGYFLIKRKIKKHPWSYTILALIFVTLLHTVYNFGLFLQQFYLFYISVIIGIVISVSFFVIDREARKKDLLYGFSSSAPRNFCSKCGSKNSSKTIFCESCGSKF